MKVFVTQTNILTLGSTLARPAIIYVRPAKLEAMEAAHLVLLTPLNRAGPAHVIMDSSKVEESVWLVICLVTDAMRQVQTIALPAHLYSQTLGLGSVCLLALILKMRLMLKAIVLRFVGMGSVTLISAMMAMSLMEMGVAAHALLNLDFTAQVEV